MRGFRSGTNYDQNPWAFLQDLTRALRAEHPEPYLVAENWGVDPHLTDSYEQQGAGFHACWHNLLRDKMEETLKKVAEGGHAFVDLLPLKYALWPDGTTLRPSGNGQAWSFVQFIEDHDRVRVGNNGARPRTPRLAAGEGRTWWARSRTRVATGLLLSAPGVPQLFMGQEILEDKQWTDNPEYYKDNVIWWEGCDQGIDQHMVNHYKFMKDLIWLRRHEPALHRGSGFRFFQPSARVIAFQRWVENEGHDVIIVASFNDQTHPCFRIPFPGEGRWRELFNSEGYEGYQADGNGGAVEAIQQPWDGLSASAEIRIPANSLLIFKR